MPAIAAILARDAPLVPSEISRAMRAMAGNGSSTPAVWQNGRVALGDAEAVATDAASGCALVMDGRLDARADLATLCGIATTALSRTTDADLLLRLFLARGIDSFETMLGDFAFVLWDAPLARLICGRDLLGMRPLFYSATKDDVIVASELQAVLRDRAGKPNLGMVAEALTGMPTSRDETLFENVFRVRPGHVLIADRADIRLTRFAQLTTPVTLSYRDPREYMKHFRTILTAAVRDRLPRNGTAGVMLSGGVDSSTIYAAARTVSDVHAYTIAHEDPALDEFPIARAVVERNGGRLYRADVSAARYDYTGEVARYRDLPTYPTGANSSGLRRLAASHAVTVLLNGVGGDECFLGHSGHWTDWLVSGEWSLLWRDLQAWRTAADAAPWWTLARVTIQPLVPRPLRRLAGAMIHRGKPFPWVPESFLRTTGFAERARHVPEERGPSFAMTGMMHSLIDGAAVAAWEDQQRLATRFGHDDRMPYLDRRVIDFALALPETVRSVPGIPKDFVRRAWSDRLPPSVMNPLDARDYAIHVVEALEAQGGVNRFDDLAIRELGWVDGAIVRRMARNLFSSAHRSRRYIAYAPQLWNVFAVDAWYRRALDLSSWPSSQSPSGEGMPITVRNDSIAGPR
jgi:asparagine synthase (glutamine-hydrolysing)